MKIAIVPSKGIGDLLIFQIASFHLQKHGYDVICDSPHRFEKWLSSFKFGSIEDADAIFLQHDNSQKSKELYKLDKPVFTFFGAHSTDKHGPLRPIFDYVADQNLTMVQNVIQALQSLFHISASSENGLIPPEGLTHKKYPKRVAIHPGSSSQVRNWPLKKYEKVAKYLENRGFEPKFIENFPSLDALASFIYESGFFLGNDSGPGHLASALQIPHLIIAKNPIYMQFWRPGWLPGKILTAPKLKFCQKYWKSFITANYVINSLKLSNY